MKQLKSIQALTAAAMVLGLFGATSAFADERPVIKTGQVEIRTNDDDEQEIRTDRDDDDSIVGTVVSVSSDGDDIVLRTHRGTVEIDAGGGVNARFRGENYRVRDLERGDRIRVDLKYRGSLRAKSIEVLSSASHRDRDNDDEESEDIEGRVTSVDNSRGSFTIRTRRGGVIDVRRERRRGTSVRVGDWVEVEGWYNGRVFVAQDVDVDTDRSRRDWERRSDGDSDGKRRN